MKSVICAAAAAVVAGSAAALVFRLTRDHTGPLTSPVQPAMLRTAADRTPVEPQSDPNAALGPAPRLVDIATYAGIDFTFYSDTQPDRFFLPETMGGGAAWLDFDCDGLSDLFLTNGCELPVHSADRSWTQRLYRQQPIGKFDAVEAVAGADLVRYGQGAAVSDIDNDGFPDLWITAYGTAALLQNNGDGSFQERSAAADLADIGWSTSAAFGDLNSDGAIDLYVAHYVQTDLENHPVCFTESARLRVYCGPGNYPAEPDSMFLNHGDGTFDRIADSFGVDPSASKGLGVVIADLDNDARPDIYVANDMQANFLLQHRGVSASGEPRFSEIGLKSGSALSGDGRAEASMGIAAADFDDDGMLDLFLTHYYREKNTYYKNLGGMQFEDRSHVVGLAAPSLPFLGFGTVPLDYDGDGAHDLFVSNGHVLGKSSQPYAMRPQLFRNVRGRFAETTGRAGAYFFQEWVGRGAAGCDFDNDGDEDLAVVHHDRPVALLRNDTDRLGTALGIRLCGLSSPRDGTGARITVRTTAQVRVRELSGGGSYLSAGDRRTLIGVSDAAMADVTVRWPSGRTDEWPSLPVGRYWNLFEGGAAAEQPFQPSTRGTGRRP